MKTRNQHVAIYLLLAVLLSCKKDKVDFINASRISGSLDYQTPTATIPVPAGAIIHISFNGIPQVQLTTRTTQKGSYSFSPQAVGSYTLRFTYTDTLISYNAAIRQKEDLDETRATSKVINTYELNAPEIQVKKDNEIYLKNALLTTSATMLSITVTDDMGNPIRDSRICIYTNKSFAEQNSPYCGGSVAYLSTDGTGKATFSGLENKKYYINARAEVGSAKLNNLWLAEMRETAVLETGKTNTKTISLR